MYMSTSSLKKVSAAAVAAVLALAGASHAAQITLPYVTNFSSTPDSNGGTYTTGALVGQNGWVNDGGNAAVTATVGPPAVTLTTGSTGINSEQLFYNSNVADHNGTVLTPATYGNQIVVGYTLGINAGGTVAADGAPISRFGTQIVDGSDNLLAALFTAPPTDPPPAPQGAPGEEDIYVQSGNNGAVVNTGLTGYSNETYSIALNFTAHDFVVTANGVPSAAYPFDPSELSASTIGGIGLYTDNAGSGNSAVFSNFSVLPEPTGFAMIGLGGLLLLAKRPSRRLA
jgi:hypothetical protein